MMMNQIVGALALTLVGAGGCDLPPKEVGSTLSGPDSDGDGATSTTSDGATGVVTAAETGTVTEPITASETGTGEVPPDVGSSDDPSGGSIPDVGSGSSGDSGGADGGPCDPITQDCPDLMGCYLEDDAFVCRPDESGDFGAAGDPCTLPNECAAGLTCAACDGSDCCVVICDLSAPLCEPEQTCVAVFAEGEAPPGLEQVGLCG